MRPKVPAMLGLKLDDRDLKILSILSREGRLSKAALAERVNLTPTPCMQRLNRLEAAGVIAGYHAEIALHKIGPHVTVFVTLELESHSAESFRSFEKLVSSREEIVNCWAVGGGLDYLLEVVTRDIDAYQRLIDGLLEAGAAIARYYTYIVTKQTKAGPLPLEAILEPGP